MSETRSPYLDYSEDGLLQAYREVQSRVRLAERSLERCLGYEQQAEAASAAVRRCLARAKGEERLIAAILNERETSFLEEGGEGEGGVQDSLEQGGLSYHPASPESPPEPRPRSSRPLPRTASR